MKNLCALIFFIYASFPTIQSWATDCSTQTWDHEVTTNKQKLFKIFRDTDRKILEKYLFSELTETKTHPGLAYYLIKYLAGTEDNENKEGFYELLRWGAEIKNEKSSVKKMKLAEICQYYEKAH